MSLRGQGHCVPGAYAPITYRIFDVASPERAALHRGSVNSISAKNVVDVAAPRRPFIEARPTRCSLGLQPPLQNRGGLGQRGDAPE